MFVRHIMVEETTLKDQQYQYANCNSGVGQVEYGPEEEEVLTTEPGRNDPPFRVITFNQWEIEHVYNFAVQEAGISVAGVEDSLVHHGAFCKQHSIEGAIEDISCRTGKNKRECHDHSGLCFFPDNRHKVPENGSCSQYPENAEKELSMAPKEFPSECHALIFNEQDIRPRSHHRVHLANGILGFNENLQHLISQKYQKNNR